MGPGPGVRLPFAPVKPSAPRPQSILIGAAAVLAAAVVIGWLAPRRRVGVQDRSRGRRNARLLAVGARTGGDLAVHRARRVFSDAARRDELDRAFELRTTAQVVETLGQMKGALMKLGQMASYLDQGMPEHVRAALAELQHDAPPMSRELADAAFEREIGMKPDEAFLEWDPTPIAAASIGQVHRALTHDGRAVAVKVQYPGVDEAVEADLGNVGLLFAGMGLLFPGLEHAPLVDELRERLREELDYRKEARNQRRFADFYRGHPVIHVPDVVDELSTPRVLTTELAEGVRWDEMLTWPQQERNLAAETIYRFAFGSLYQLHTFNGDPHPGNYLFQKGGRVTFLDFGLVKHFTDDDLRAFEDMTRTMVLENDVAAFRRTVEQIGFLRPGGSFTDEEVGEYFGHFYEFVLDDRVRTITTDYASENVRRFFDASGPFGDIMKAANVPPSMVIIQRINLGLYAIFGEMGATANWRRIAEELWPFVHAAPSTPIGEAVTAWEASHRQEATA
jgi:predicted unusual protein kinase regulating ubiquinone biosynthesis (AarF/ABC1/UbiB family)